MQPVVLNVVELEANVGRYTIDEKNAGVMARIRVMVSDDEDGKLIVREAE